MIIPIGPLHMGHSFLVPITLAAQFAQRHRWPHGTTTCVFIASKHTTLKANHNHTFVHTSEHLTRYMRRSVKKAIFAKRPIANRRHAKRPTISY